MKSKSQFGLVCAACIFSSWLLARIYQEIVAAYDASGTILVTEFSWFFRLMLNLVGYGTVLVPMYIMYQYLTRTNYFDNISNPTMVSRMLSRCFRGGGGALAEGRAGRGTGPGGALREGAELAFCFCGLMGAYLVWGLLQEKIMTQDYVMPDGSHARFADSQFLVLVNRMGALLAATTCLMLGAGRPGGGASQAAPLYQFSYCALTNVMSAWCQYEALKYVNFPTQVLSKSCKLIPVLLMSRFISGKSHPNSEYLAAAATSVGMVLFVTGSKDHHAASSVMTASGLALLLAYLACDSFTASWQAELFRRHQVTPLQMMCYVNLFSVLLPGAALLQAGGTAASFALLTHPLFVSDVVLLSLSSALGQLLIYRTIARFGAVTFTVIMTVRQAVSILLSCLVFGHEVSSIGALGVALVFAAVLARAYCRTRRDKAKDVLKT